MITPLFYPFLEDKNIHNLAEAWWRRLFTRLFADFGYHRFYNNRYVNGEKGYDGNPIFDAYFPGRHKLVRIIQELPEDDAPYLSAYEVPTELNSGGISRPLFPLCFVARRSQSSGYFPSSRLAQRENSLPKFSPYLIPQALDFWPMAEMNDDAKPTPADPAKFDQPIPELVLVLTLTPETAEQARQWLQSWIVEDLGRVMEGR